MDLLKKNVLTNACYQALSPSDCKALSTEIFRKTGHQLSETTLKRIYGFAYSKFQPSLFTLDAMSRFSGYDSWLDFCEKNTVNHPEAPHNDGCWESLKKSATRTSGFTLQVLKNRSGIPYRFTVNRKFIADHFEAFLKNDYTATAFIAPAGYGKTIALCHWVEEKMMAIAERKSDDIVLFISSNALVNAFSGEKDIKEWLLSLLGYGNENDISALLDKNQENAGNFYLIIDGLDEHMFRDEQFNVLFNLVLDIFSLYRFHSNFKLVLTMRSATWINHRHEIIDEDAWFKGFMTDKERSINTPLFETTELEELCSRINPYANNAVGIDAARNFNIPLYLQYYYKAHRTDFSFNYINHTCIYELISEFVLNKIYLGPFATEKTQLIRTLAEGLNYEHEIFEVEKVKVNDLVKQNAPAYNELLGIGFIREVNKSTDAQCRVVIEFCTDKFLEYSIAFAMLSRNGNQFNNDLIDQVNTILKHGHRVQVLKWCLFYAIKNGQHQCLEFITRAKLTVQEKSEVIIFMGEILDQSRSQIGMAESIVQYFNRDCSDGLFDYFFGLEFICNDYIKTLQTLLRFELSPCKKLMLYTGLASIAAVQLDTNRLENYLANIKSFPPEDMQAFPVNPLNCLETIYYWLKYNILKKDSLKELTAFYFNPPARSFAKNNTNDLLFLLALFTLSICKSSTKTHRLLRAMDKVYQTDASRSDAYHFIVALFRVENHFRMNDLVNANILFEEINAMYEPKRSTFTPFIKTFFHLVKLQMALSEGQEHVQELIRSLSFLADEASLKLFKLDAIALVLANCHLLVLDEQFTKRLNYEFICLIRENGLQAENFLNNNVPIISRN
jgi:hypothetical protein